MPAVILDALVLVRVDPFIAKYVVSNDKSIGAPLTWRTLAYTLRLAPASAVAIFNVPDVVLVRKNQALAQYLVRAQSAWKLTYQDNVFALFVPIKVS